MSDISPSEKAPAPRIPGWRLVTNQRNVTDAIINHPYQGSGTSEDPYVVEWLDDDPIDPYGYPNWKKWMITMIMAFSTLSITFSSSGLSGADPQLELTFGASAELVTAEVSLFVLAFAIGPVIWAPLSELYGRQILFGSTYAGVTLFSGATLASKNIGTLLVLRFFAGAFGASAITNAAGTVSDLFNARERGLAAIVYVAAPFLGPVLGPIACGFLAQNEGWKWVAGIITIFSGVCWIAGLFLVPETYAPVLLKQRAFKLSQLSGKVYRSKLEIENSHKTPRAIFDEAMVRPWILLFKEPIVLLLSLYMAIIYGTLYLSFAAFPIVFFGHRGWSQGVSGLSFIGVMIGQILGMFYAIFDNGRYRKVCDRSPNGRAPPEARLAPSMVGAIALPVGLFWFAWTNGPNVHWAVSLVGIAPFGFGQVLVFLSVSLYLIDSYTVYAASALAANAVIRALFGAAFPLFTTPMFDNLGIHWASTIPAFLALACLPFPFLFHRYGLPIRKRCAYSSDALRITEEVMKKSGAKPAGDEKVLMDDEETTVADGELATEEGVSARESGGAHGSDLDHGKEGEEMV